MIVYYRIYAEDGALPSNTPVSPGDPFLGRIKYTSVPPPRTARTVKRCIANMENIENRERTSLFLTLNSQSPMDDTDKVSILNGTGRTGPGSTPQEPIALVLKMSDSERRALESARGGGLAEPDTTSPGIRFRTSVQHPYFSFATY